MSLRTPLHDLFAAISSRFDELVHPHGPRTGEPLESPATTTEEAARVDSCEAPPSSVEQAASAAIPPSEDPPPAAVKAPRRRRTKLVADPGLAALRVRIAAMETQVVDLETRKAEVEQLLEEFAFRQYQALGDLLSEQLRLQYEILQLRADRSLRPDDRQAADAAGDEYQAYEQARNAPAATQAIELADDEREELKALYRAAAMRCHPDRVDDAAKALAHEMFLRTQDAYRRGDLETMRLISRQLAAGEAPSPGGDKSAPRERLEALLDSLLDKGAELMLAIQTIQMQAQYRRARHRDDWQDYFAAARDQLEAECAALRQQLSHY